MLAALPTVAAGMAYLYFGDLLPWEAYFALMFGGAAAILLMIPVAMWATHTKDMRRAISFLLCELGSLCFFFVAAWSLQPPATRPFIFLGFLLLFGAALVRMRLDSRRRDPV